MIAGSPDTVPGALPRVLFVTPHAFNAVTGGGITFSALFRGWPEDRIATVHNDPEPTTGDVCRRYFVLGRDELDYAPPLPAIRRLLGRGAGGDGGPSGPTVGVNAAAGGGAGGGAEGGAEGGGRAGRWLRNAAIAALGDGFPERAVLTPRLAAWIEAFKPDVLYTILGSNGMMALTEAIRRRFALPMIVHVMDDWMSSRHRHGLLAPFLRHAMERRVRHAMQVASGHFSISPAMTVAFSERYGRPFEAFQNTIDTARWLPRARRAAAAGSPADILYVGSIFPEAQLETLASAARAVAMLDESGFPATLTISTPSGHAERHRARLAIHPAIRLIDTIRDDDAFFARIAAADLLLLPVNFDAGSIAFIRYSMPTKVPAYLTTGAPILAVGPAEVAQIAYAMAEGWAFTETRPGDEPLAAAIRLALTDREGRERVMARARVVARAHHDAGMVRARFRARLTAIAGGGGPCSP
ncbi:glycosyltransferase family 4 protein [Rhabdaerophilum calidifontis]|uniref:glycosyltransferase family 4 protein n=1 Tax=Rhabdaerophilum calidifontis TaxID=2604328 RepID=UPI00123BADAF|nr:glycosyltransferase family 4 protein [Rhabdaerophilum calidifontis]